MAARLRSHQTSFSDARSEDAATSPHVPIRQAIAFANTRLGHQPAPAQKSFMGLSPAPICRVDHHRTARPQQCRATCRRSGPGRYAPGMDPVRRSCPVALEHVRPESPELRQVNLFLGPTSPKAVVWSRYCIAPYIQRIFGINAVRSALLRVPWPKVSRNFGM